MILNKSLQTDLDSSWDHKSPALSACSLLLPVIQIINPRDNSTIWWNKTVTACWLLVHGFVFGSRETGQKESLHFNFVARLIIVRINIL